MTFIVLVAIFSVAKEDRGPSVARAHISAVIMSVSLALNHIL